MLRSQRHVPGRKARMQYKILILAPHWAVASGRYIMRAFRRLGHDVRTCGTPMGRKIWNIEVDERHVWQPDYPEMTSIFDEGWRPDVAIATWPGIDFRAGMPFVVWGVDNHATRYTGADHYFLAHYEGVEMPIACQCDNRTWIPCAADAEWFNYKIPITERRIHAAMLGNLYPQRQALLAALSSKFHIVAGIGPLYAEFETAYNNAVVSVCASYNRDAAQRIFESARMGNVILSDYCPDFARLDFKAGVHYLEYESAADAIEIMTNLFNGPRERMEELSHNARQWAIPHTWEARAKMVIEVLIGRGLLC